MELSLLILNCNVEHYIEISSVCSYHCELFAIIIKPIIIIIIITTTSYNIEQHQESTHTVPFDQTNSVLTFPCSTCGLTFLDINELSNHVQRHHVFPNLEPQSNRTADSINFMNYIIEKNQEIIEHIRDFKDEVSQRLDKLTNEQYNFIKEFEVLGNKVNTLTSQLNDFNTPNIIRTVEKPVKDVEAPEAELSIL